MMARPTQQQQPSQTHRPSPPPRPSSLPSSSSSCSSSLTTLTDLASSNLGSKILFATDEWFATANNLLSPNPPEFKVGEFTEFGKWMDGWETRRRRTAGFDFCIIKLGREGRVKGFEINTKYFTGNYAPRVTVQATRCPDMEHILKSFSSSSSSFQNGKEEEQHEKENKTTHKYMEEIENNLGRIGTGVSRECREWFEQIMRTSVKWKTLILEEPLGSGLEETCMNLFEVDSEGLLLSSAGDEAANNGSFTHIKLNMLPDGGIARFRVFGEIQVLSLPFLISQTSSTGVRYRTPTPTIPSSSSSSSSQISATSSSFLPFVECNEHKEIDLSAALNGGVCLCWSDAHYGQPRNLLLRQSGDNMGCGWETARSLLRPSVLLEDPVSGRIKNFPPQAVDWVIIKLGGRGEIRKIEIDTQHFKGNPPESIQVDGWDDVDVFQRGVMWQKMFFEQTEEIKQQHNTNNNINNNNYNNNNYNNNKSIVGVSSTRQSKRPSDIDRIDWKPLLPRIRLQADNLHTFVVNSPRGLSCCTHVRLKIFPDGGIMRVRMWGTLPERPAAAL
eukprot:GHVS01097338.1.p1 GENE.GHVS01097338.1~~GHVS01097338.1.p1  ORF type:complete len:558 (-),score=125.97 GHVS01097338.1:230-1903(-)